MLEDVHFEQSSESHSSEETYHTARTQEEFPREIYVVVKARCTSGFVGDAEADVTYLLL